MTSAVDDVDELWTFGNASGAVPLSDSSGESSDEEYTKPVKPTKRRRSEKAVVPDLVILDDSDGDSDSDLEIVEQLNRRKGKKAQNVEDPFFDLTVRVVREPAVRLSTPLEAEATLRMRNSLQQLKQMRSLLDAAESQQEDKGNDGDEEGNGEDEPVAPANMQKNSEKIVVKIRWAQNEDPLKLRVGTDVALERLFASFQQALQKKGKVEAETVIRFMFDGEIIQPEQTAEELEIEDDCVIEASW